VAGVTTPTVNALGKDEGVCFTEPGLNTSILINIIGVQALVVIILYIMTCILKHTYRRCNVSRRIASTQRRSSDRQAMCDVYIEFGNGFKICRIYVCSLQCHAANISVTKTSQKIRVEKYFNNTIYDALRMEWFSLSLKIHPMA
jgi:hypothetical protein